MLLTGYSKISGRTGMIIFKHLGRPGFRLVWGLDLNLGLMSYDLQLTRLTINFRINVVECSALNSYNISGLFKSFLVLSKIDLGVLSGTEK